MATVLIKNLKLPRLPNVRLNLIDIKSNFSHRNIYIARSCRQLQCERNKLVSRCYYSTAAPQRVLNEEPVTRYQSNREIIRIKDIHSVDKALERIDWIIKGSGRILMQDVADVFSKISAKQMPTSTQGLYLLRCCKYIHDVPSPERIQFVDKMWNRFQELGVKFDVRHYNTLLEIHIYNDLVFEPAEFLTSMEEQGVEPNKNTCVLLMKKYCKDGNIGGASEILQYMKDKGFAANEEVFNNLIQAHLKNKDFTGAKDMMEVMRSLNLNPTEDTYVTFACGYATEGDKDQMMSYLLGQENKVPISNENYLKVIEALAHSKNDQYVDDVLSLMTNISGYRQECINTAIDLIHKGCINTAYKLIIASADPLYNQGTNIFIRQLIKTKQPPSQILDYCNDISNKGLNDIILLNAQKASCDNGNIDCAFLLLKERIARGHPVRNASLFPLFTSMKKTKSSEDVWQILKYMRELGIPAEFTTYLDYVYPSLGVPDPKDIIENVKKSGQFTQTAVDALFVYYCNLGKIDLAFELLQTVPVYVSSRIAFKNFLDRYEKLDQSTENKYFQILKYILENVEAIRANIEGYQAKFLAEIILRKPELFDAFLRKFEHEDLAISEYSQNTCEKILKYNNPAGITLLRRLKTKTSRMRDMTVEEEDEQLNTLRGQKNCKQFLIDRILHHSKLKNVDRVLELVDLYEEMDFVYTPIMLAQLTNVYAYIGDLEKTMETFSKLKKDFPTFKLEIEKVLEFSSLLIKYNKYDDALNILKNNLSEPYIYGSRMAVFKSIRRITALACDTENVEFVKKFQKLLMPLSKDFGPKKLFLEPLIDIHLHRNDLVSALDEYRKCIISHKTPAGLNIFLKKCIALSDKTHLQKVTDMTADHLGKSIALVELALAFVETGLVHKAKLVFQNLGREADSVILEDACMKLCERNKLSDLEQFIYVTRDLTHIDRERLYHHLFKLCDTRNDWGKALNVLDRLRSEGIEPSAKTIDILSDLLKRNNQPIPFSLLPQKPSESDVPLELPVGATKAFLEHLQAGNVELALEKANELKKGYIRTLSLQSLTDLLDLCIQNNCVEKLSSNVNVMSYTIENARDVLKPLLEKYSEMGDVEKIISVANVMPDFSLKQANYNFYFCQAFISSGKHEKLLSCLEEQCDSNNKMFSTVAFEELLKFPEFEDRIVKLAMKLYEKNYHLPIAVVWAHFFINGNHDKAIELHKKFPFPIDRIDTKVLRAIRQDENISLGQAYVNFINQVVAKPRIKERAFGTFLDVLVLKQKYDEAVSLVLESEKLELHLHKYYRSTLVTLKNALERENKPVPFRIPSGDFSQSSSSSDSE